MCASNSCLTYEPGVITRCNPPSPYSTSRWMLLFFNRKVRGSQRVKNEEPVYLLCEYIYTISIPPVYTWLVRESENMGFIAQGRFIVALPRPVT